MIYAVCTSLLRTLDERMRTKTGGAVCYDVLTKISISLSNMQTKGDNSLHIRRFELQSLEALLKRRSPSEASKMGRFEGVTRNLLICVLAVCCGTQFMFYNVIVGNNISGVLQIWFNESYSSHYHTTLTDETFSLVYSFVTACLQVGALVASLFLKLAAERLGRRKSLMLTAFFEIVGAIVAGCAKSANSLEVLGVGRFIIGLGFGMGTGVGSMLISELAPIKVRGAIGTIQQIFIGLGMTMAFVLTLPELLGTEALWPVAVAVPGVAALIQFIVLTQVHDSPKFLLLTKQNREASLQSLQFYKGHLAAEETIRSLEKERDQANNTRKVTFGEVLTKRMYRRPLIIAFVIMVAVQFTGIASIMSYSKTIFMQSGLDTQAAELGSMGLGIMNLISPFLVLFLIEKLGRRILLLAGLTLACTMMLITTLLIQFNYPTVAIPFVYLFQVGYAVASSVAWVIPSEMFPQNARSFGVAVAVVSFFLSQFITVVGYLPFKDAVGVPLSFVPFMVVTGSSAVFFFFYLPETKGVSPEKLILEENDKRSQKKKKRTADIAPSSNTPVTTVSYDTMGEETRKENDRDVTKFF